MNCPICKLDIKQSTQICRADLLTRRWSCEYGINVDRLLGNVATIDKWHCSKCDFAFYDPALVGDGQFYQDLQRHEFYYQQDKWEHQQACKLVKKNMHIVEIGCGSGAFLQKVRSIDTVSAIGLELNAGAVDAARGRGLDVRQVDLFDFAQQNSGTADMVVHFQVLEHVPDPTGFVQACRLILKNGGVMVFAVPNNGAFINSDPTALLNMPPHHLCGFQKKSLRRLLALSNFDILRMSCEPLASVHTAWLAGLLLDRCPKVPYLTWPIISLLRPRLSQWMKNSSVRKVFRGHSLFVACRRLN